MHVVSHHLRQFRNLAALDWKPAPGLSLITGDNGQGKTNLLESIHMGLLGRSFRTRKDSECIAWPKGVTESGAIIELELRRPVGIQSNRIVLTEHAKQCFREGRLLARLGDLWSGSPVVTFRPEDVDVFRDTPARRRRLLDLALCQSSTLYMESLKNYQKAMRELNILLKPRSGRSSREQARAYYHLLAASGAVIMQMRAAMLEDLKSLCASRFTELGGTAELRLEYEPDMAAALKGKSAPEADALMAMFESRWADHTRMGALDCGPHRDDFLTMLGGQELGKFGSQGQNRLAALALTLAIAFRLSEKMGDPPVLLLDDFGSELDPARRAAVLAGLRGKMQTFVTATSVADLGGADAFDEVRRIHAGNWISEP